MNEIQEMHFYRNGVVQKKVLFIKYPRNFIIQEQEAKYDIGVKTNVVWDTSFQIEFPNYEYAKTCFMGRISKAAFEEGGVGTLEQERREAALYKPLMQGR